MALVIRVSVESRLTPIGTSGKMRVYAMAHSTSSISISHECNVDKVIMHSQGVSNWSFCKETRSLICNVHIHLYVSIFLIQMVTHCVRRGAKHVQLKSVPHILFSLLHPFASDAATSFNVARAVHHEPAFSGWTCPMRMRFILQLSLQKQTSTSPHSHTNPLPYSLLNSISSPTAKHDWTHVYIL